MPGGSIPHWPWHRRALSKWGNRYACVVLGMSVHDATAGFRAFAFWSHKVLRWSAPALMALVLVAACGRT